MTKTFVTACLLAGTAWPASAQEDWPGLAAKPIASYTLAGGRTISRIDVELLKLAPGARAAPMAHTAAVLGYVAEGTIVIKLTAGTDATLSVGDSVFAPAGVTVERLENASATEPATFIATFLLGPQDKQTNAPH